MRPQWSPGFREELRRHTAAVLRARADYYAHPNTSCHRCGRLIPVLPHCPTCRGYVTKQREVRLAQKETA